MPRLTRFPGRVNRLYAVDLIGAALGCVLLVVLFSWFDGPSLVIFIAALAAVGVRLLRGCGRARTGATLLTAGLVLRAGVRRVGQLPPPRRRPRDVRVRLGEGSARPDSTTTSAGTRSRALTVDGDPSDPGTVSWLWSSTAPRARPAQWSGDRSKHGTTCGARSRTWPTTSADDADVCVIGVGGGRDVLSALEFETTSVTGVEINGDIIDIATARSATSPATSTRTRASTSSTTRRGATSPAPTGTFDIIQISLIDTWAATSSGAFALSENSPVHDPGVGHVPRPPQRRRVLSVSRFYQTTIPREDVQPLETYRTVALAAKVAHGTRASRTPATTSSSMTRPTRLRRRAWPR